MRMHERRTPNQSAARKGFPKASGVTARRDERQIGGVDSDTHRTKTRKKQVRFLPDLMSKKQPTK